MSQHRPDADPDGAFDRLRAADPAAGHAPDSAALDAAVRHRLGRPDEQPLHPGLVRPDEQPLHPGLGRPDDEVARARAARRPGRWSAVAAVAAGTLVLGSVGGYALGARTDGGTQAAAPAISLGGGAGAPEGAGSEQDAASSASGELRAGDAAASVMPWFGGRTVFTAQGLSDEGGTARAWSYDPAQVFSAETATRVASSLGLAGEARLEGGTWVVGSQDGMGANLQLQPDGMANVSYYDPSRDPFGCPSALPTPEGAGGDGSAPSPGRDEPSAPPCEPTTHGPAPQGDEALARAREVMTAAGVDPAGYELEVVEAGNPDAVYVAAYQVLEGQRTGATWNLTLVGTGVQSLYGPLAPLVPLGEYEVVSPQEAVARLTDPRFGAISGGAVIAASGAAAEKAVAEDATASGSTLAEPEPEPAPIADPTPPRAAQPGEPLDWPVEEVVLTGARLGLAQHVQPDGATVLVPAYELSDGSGSVWSVIAVAESGLDLAPVG